MAAPAMTEQHATTRPAPSREKAVEIARILRTAGYRAFLVGGCVRDELLGRLPKDYDIATDAPPERIEALFPHSRLVGAQFGVMLVVEHSVEYQVSTFRADGVYRDGRHPESIRLGTMEEDAQRRDFTVNGIYLDPETGDVIDCVGGRRDLRQRSIRAIGNPGERFREDYLRMLRAVRFAAQLSFTIESATWDAIRDNAPRITGISGERIRDELALLLTSAHPGDGVRLLADSGLLREILPEIEAMRGIDQPPEFHLGYDVFEHTCRALDELDEPDVVLALAVLLHDVGKPRARSIRPDKNGAPRIRFFRHDKIGAAMTRHILRRLRFPTSVIDDVEACVANHMRIKDAPRFRKANLRRLLARRTFHQELELHRIDCAVSHCMMTTYEFLSEARKAYGNDAPVPPPLVGGNDLIGIGYTPGARLGRVLRHLQELQLEGRINTPEEALAIARQGSNDDGFPPAPAAEEEDPSPSDN